MGTSEHLWYRMGHLASNNFVMVAQIEGELNEEQLIEALQSVVAAQPMLRTSVKKVGNKIRLFECSATPVKIAIEERANDEGWESKAVEEMNSEISVESEVLWRFAWLKGNGKHDLVMTFNHMIADGRSGLNFFEMLFSTLVEKDIEFPRLKLFPAYEKQMQKTDNIFSCIIKFFKAFQNYISSKKLEWNKIPQTLKAESSTALISRALDAGETINLVQKCRENKTTVSSFLAASMLELEKGAYNTSLSLAVDMRPYLREIHGKEIAYFVTSLDLVKEASFSGNKWDLAEVLSHRIKQQMNKSQFLFDQLIRFLAFKTAKTNDKFRHLIKDALNNSMLLTNIGKVDMKTDYGSFKLKHCFHVPSVHLMGLPFFCLATSTLNGQMVLNFTYNAGCMKLEEAEKRVAEFMKSLHSL